MPLLYGRKAISNCKLKTTKVMHFRTQLPHTSKELHTLPYPQISPARGVSPFTSFPDRQKMKGSMTVEASLAVPLFLFFIMNILSITLFFTPLRRIWRHFINRAGSCLCWLILWELRMR